MSSELKKRVIDYAEEKGESEAIVVREALNEYFTRRHLAGQHVGDIGEQPPVYKSKRLGKAPRHGKNSIE